MSCSSFSNSGSRIPVSSCEPSKTHQPEDVGVGVNLQDPLLNIHQVQENSGFELQGPYLKSTRESDGAHIALQVQSPTLGDISIQSCDSGRERLKRYRSERASGKVWIPEVWGQEELLKDWIDCSAFDESLIPHGIMSARAALVDDGRRGKFH